MRYESSGNWLTIDSNNSFFIMPVGRVNARKPLGHSGQRKLHDVVGSMEMLMGIPLCFIFFEIFDDWKLEYTRSILCKRAGVCLPMKLKPSISSRTINAKNNTI